MTIQRKRVAKRLASGLLAGAVAFGGLALSGSGSVSAAPVLEDSDFRLGGSDRYATSALIAEEMDDTYGVTRLIVASGENFPDALAASGLVGSADDTAVLLVKANEITDSVRNRMNRLSNGVNQVFVVGGTSVISDAVFAELESIFDEADVDRLAGADRYATAVAIAEEVDTDSLALIVSGEGYADALSVASIAADQDYPVILANGSGLPASSLTYLEDLGASRVVIVGGPLAVGANTESQLIEAGYAPEAISRLAGADRYQTNFLLNLELFADTTKTAFDSGETAQLLGQSITLMSGTGFADALSATPLIAAEASHPVLVSAAPSPFTLALMGVLGAPGAQGDVVGGASLVAGGWGSNAIDIQAASLLSSNETWIIGGTSAVPSATVTAMNAAQNGTNTLNCAVVVGGASVAGDGPTSALVVFLGNLSSAYGDAEVAVDLTGQSATQNATATAIDAAETTEADYILNNYASFFEADGTGQVASATGLDLNDDGFPDAVSLTFDDDLERGDRVEFAGFDIDIDEWTDNGIGGRTLNPCSALVGRDTTAPTVTIEAGDSTDQVVVEFSETLSDDYSADDWAGILEKKLTTDDSDGATCVAEKGTSDYFICTMGAALGNADVVAITDAYIDETTDGVDYNGDGDILDTAVQIAMYDSAGNELVMPDTATSEVDFGLDFNGDGDILDAAETSDAVAETLAAYTAGPEIASVTGTCSSKNATATDFWESYWDLNEGAGTYVTSGAKATFNVDNDGGTFTFTAETRGTGANAKTVTITHQRGLIVPSAAIDASGNTVITIDRYVHTDTDIARLVNSSATVGATWAVTANDDALVDVDAIDEVFSAETVGTEGDQSCILTVTLDASSVSNWTIVTGTPATDGQIKITIGGQAVASADVTLADHYIGGADSGNVIKLVLDDITVDGAIRVALVSEAMDSTAGSATYSAASV